MNDVKLCDYESKWFEAAETGNIFIASENLEEDPGIFVDMKNAEGKTAFMISCERGHGEFAFFMISKGTFYRAFDPEGYTGIHLFMKNRNNISDVRKRADKNGHRGPGTVYWNSFIEKFMEEIEPDKLEAYLDYDKKFKDFLENPANAFQKKVWDLCRKNVESEINFLKYLEAVKTGDVAEFNRFVDCFPVDKQDKTGKTPLFHACENGMLEISELLLNRGANPSIKSDDESFMFEKAVRGRRFDIVKLLLENGVDVNTKDEYMNTTAIYVCEANDVDALLNLIDLKADLTIENKWKENCLFVSCKNGNREVAEICFNLGVPYEKDLLKNSALGDYMNEHVDIDCSFVEFMMERVIGIDKLNEYLKWDESLSDLIENNPEKKEIWNHCRMECENRARVKEHLLFEKQTDSADMENKAKFSENQESNDAFER